MSFFLFVIYIPLYTSRHVVNLQPVIFLTSYRSRGFEPKTWELPLYGEDNIIKVLLLGFFKVCFGFAEVLLFHINKCHLSDCVGRQVFVFTN